MKYLVWYKQARAIAANLGVSDFDGRGGWRDSFHDGLTPEEAVNLSLIE
tara:strand:+ start:362 stop:508 length:147 start_codon:yes stop_codon:yes gene_type:complete